MAVCLGAAAVATLAAAFEAGLPFALTIAAAGAGLGVMLVEPRLVVPLLTLALPLELSKTWIPFFESRADLGGGLPPTSIVDLGRLAVAGGAVVWLVRPLRARWDAVPPLSLVAPVAALAALYAASSLWSYDAGDAGVETLRLLFLGGSAALVAFFVPDRAALRWTIIALMASAGALSVVSVYQQATGDFFWNEGLGLYGERRVNTTFADPNHLARLLLIALLLLAAWWPFAGRRVRALFLAPCAALSLLALVFTGSRGTWLAAAALLPLLLLALPLPSRQRLALTGGGAAVALALVGGAAIFSPWFQDRLSTARFGLEAAGARPYLVEAGLAMFKDRPVAGVGAGNYQAAFEADYLHFKDPKIKADITMSHTSLVTMMAELGALGLIGLVWLGARWLSLMRQAWARARAPDRALTLGISFTTVAIFLGSQTEGRLLEDPYLWLFFGLGLAHARIVRAEAEAKQ